ncbi:hypothetical protein M422DRAFT_246354 [Sphaerobolus stellatus SS14]|nr:hypothetical protein M422DRAFT_246354 [Sphaerobolus stellatus SS14]
MSSPPPPAVPPPSARPSTRHLSTAPPPLPHFPMSSPSSLCCTALRPSARPSTRHLSAPLPLPHSPMSSPPPSTALHRCPLPFVISMPRHRCPALPCPPHRLLLLRCAAALCTPLHSPSQRPAAAAAPLSHVLSTSSLCCVVPLPSVRPSTRHLSAPLPLPRSPMSSPPSPSAALRHRPLHALHSPSQHPTATAPLSHVLPTTSLCCAAPPPSARPFTRHLSALLPLPRSPMSSPPPPFAALRCRPLCAPPLTISVSCCCCHPVLPCPSHLLPLQCCAAAFCHSSSQRPTAAAPLSHVLPTSSFCCTAPPPSVHPSTRHPSALPLLPRSPMSSPPPPSAALRRYPLRAPPLTISAPCCHRGPTLPCPPHLLLLLCPAAALCAPPPLAISVPCCRCCPTPMSSPPPSAVLCRPPLRASPLTISAPHHCHPNPPCQFHLSPIMGTTNEALEAEIAAEQLRLNIEDDEHWTSQDYGDTIVQQALADFPEEKPLTETDKQLIEAAEAITQNSIKEGTHTGHTRIIQCFIKFMLQSKPNWAAVWRKPKAALTFFYKSLHPDESVTEWWVDKSTGDCYGLPTRSPVVSQFMLGLEKTKAAAGEISQSARALTLEDMQNLHKHCLERPDQTLGEYQAGIVRYTVYLFAWLLLLRIEEAVSLKFESIDLPPGECCHFEVRLLTRKTAQTGISHTWKLFANDEDPRICPVHAIIRLARLYGESVAPTGPLFF